jgi:hypothetical protein
MWANYSIKTLYNELSEWSIATTGNGRTSEILLLILLLIMFLIVILLIILISLSRA